MEVWGLFYINPGVANSISCHLDLLVLVLFWVFFGFSCRDVKAEIGKAGVVGAGGRWLCSSFLPGFWDTWAASSVLFLEIENTGWFWLFLTVLMFLLHSVTPLFPPNRIKVCREGEVMGETHLVFFPLPYFTFAFPNKPTSGSALWVQLSAGLACRVGSSLLREVTGLDPSLIHILESPKSHCSSPHEGKSWIS